ncbi:MAG: discoidin domain-containing protein [Chthoniobacterales bacterium]|nr:discoidin domain-containing protein [Chthoniobacterales bacterium]
MAGNLQPLFSNQAIVDVRGQPTEYFIRWAQQRQIDIGAGITAEQAQQLIDDFAAARDIIAGVALHGGGNLSSDITIDHADSLVTPGTYGDATHVAQFVVDQQGHIQGVVEVAISGGGGGGGPSGPYRYWKWNNIIHGADGSSLSRAEFLTPAAVAIANPTPNSNYNSYPASNLFDGNPGTLWSTYGGQADGDGVSVSFDFGVPVTIGSINLDPRNDGYPNQTPIEMQWLCSTDGLVWLMVCTIQIWPDMTTTPFVTGSTLNVPVLAT